MPAIGKRLGVKSLEIPIREIFIYERNEISNRTFSVGHSVDKVVFFFQKEG